MKSVLFLYEREQKPNNYRDSHKKQHAPQHITWRIPMKRSSYVPL